MEQTLTAYQRGNRLFVQKRFEDAIHAFLEEAGTNPGKAADAYERVGMCYRRTNIITRPIAIAPGVKLIGQGNREYAEAYYRRALELDPNHLGALLGLAQVLQTGEEAISLLKRATDIQPSVLPLGDLGDLYADGKDYARAYEAYKRGVEADRRELPMYDKLARMCEKLGRPEEAQQWRDRKHEARR